MSDPISIPRKPHHCRLCGQTIPAGEPCRRWSGFAHGKPFTSHAHPECYAETRDWKWDDWETCGPGDMKRPGKAKLVLL